MRICPVTDQMFENCTISDKEKDSEEKEKNLTLKN